VINTLFRPVEPFAQISREMDRILAASPARPAPANWPGLNLWRDAEAIVAEAEVPGFRAQDVEVTVTDDTLTVRGTRSAGVPENAVAIRVERSVSRFERSVRLPAPVDADAVSATLTDGVLRVTMPLAAAARPRRIEVRALDGAARREALPSGRGAQEPAESNA
jgi:HSP20 family protein